MKSKIRMIKYWVKALMMLTLVPVFLFNCKEDPYIYVCKEGIVEYQLLAPFEEPNHSLKNLDAPPDIKGSSVNLLIESEDEYRTYVSSKRVLPKIDFKRQTLLAGMSYNTTIAVVVGQQILSKCSSNEIFFTIDQKFGNQQIGGVTYYFAIIPKMSVETKVRFVINYV